MESRIESLFGRDLILKISENHPYYTKCENLYSKLLEVSLGRQDPKSCVSSCYLLKVEFKHKDEKSTIVKFKSSNIQKKFIGFKQEIQQFNLPSDVVSKAIDIHRSVRVIRKQTNRKLLIFNIILLAYKSLNMVVIPQLLGDMMGLKKNEIVKSFSLVIPILCGVTYRQINYDPIRYTSYLLELMGVDKNILNCVNNMIISITTKNEIIFDNFMPQDVAYCAIISFCQKFNYQIISTPYVPKNDKIKKLSLIFEEYYS